MSTHYTPVHDGYEIVGSQHLFNRALYGGHANDHLTERYFTFAGDQPLILGAVTDWRAEAAGNHAKCGTFMAGLAMTPDMKLPMVMGQSVDVADRYSQWLHTSYGTVSTYRNGWMEYRHMAFGQCFPRVDIHMEVLPLIPEDGFLVNLRIETDQFIRFCAGFGGITGFLGRMEFPYVPARNFHAEDCIGNRVEIGDSRAIVTGEHEKGMQSEMWIGSSFPMDFSVGDAKLVSENPGRFLARDADPGDTPLVRMECAVGGHEVVEGVIVVVRNAGEEALDRWLARENPVADLKRASREKSGVVEVKTPDEMLDITVPSNILAVDAAWHKPAFHHGTYGWHTPYIGWRTWYGPTVMGWHDRVDQCFRTHAAGQVMESDGPEEVMYEGPHQYYSLKNSTGSLPDVAGTPGCFYTMQEVGVDMFLHHLEWTRDLDGADEMFDVISRILDWEERILDPDGDGLYQNWLNTWVSDAHSYNGGGCAQSSAYNYRANRVMAKLACLTGRDPDVFYRRAEKIREALFDTLWLPEKGVMAEYVDTIGNCLVHPSPELATAYHTIESGLVDEFQAYQMLRFTETDMRSERTMLRGGRLVWSSNWYPQNYSSCGLYSAENLHLSWAYFRIGQVEKGMEILDGVVDAHFISMNPGVSAHCMVGTGEARGAQDFTDVTSMHLRTVVEGVYGIHVDLLDGLIEITPNFPDDWDHARLTLPDVCMGYTRHGNEEVLETRSHHAAERRIALRMRSNTVQAVLLDGKPVEWEAHRRVNRCDIVVKTATAAGQVRVIHGEGVIPTLSHSDRITVGDTLSIRVSGGEIRECRDPSSVLSDKSIGSDRVSGRVAGEPGGHTVFVRVRSGDWHGWLTADVAVEAVANVRPVIEGGEWQTVDMSDKFTMTLSDIHQQEYWNPRPDGYSIRTALNGRFGWDWNHAGYNKVVVDETRLRESDGVTEVKSGIPFSTPADGPNVTCASIWENHPEEITISLSGSGVELAVLFAATTNPMQTAVENARFTVNYADGSGETLSLVYPENIDDWLVAAHQPTFETHYFSDYNHAVVARIPLERDRELTSLSLRAVANEVIVGVMGVSIRRGW